MAHPTTAAGEVRLINPFIATNPTLAAATTTDNSTATATGPGSASQITAGVINQLSNVPRSRTRHDIPRQGSHSALPAILSRRGFVGLSNLSLQAQHNTECVRHREGPLWLQRLAFDPVMCSLLGVGRHRKAGKKFALGATKGLSPKP